MEKIEIADIIFHKPSGEEWVVAKVNEQYLWPAGWPCCRAKLKDCELRKKASEGERNLLLNALHKLPIDDERRGV